MTRSLRFIVGTAAAGLLALGVAPSPAGAHISADKAEVAAGSYTQVSFTVPHGCDDAATTALVFGIPEAILNAAPQVRPGWDVSAPKVPLETPVEDTSVTERVAEITFTAQPGNELPSAFRDVFTIGFQAPDTPGEELLFPITQVCGDTSIDWAEPVVEGEDEPEHPAVVVAIGESQGDGHGHGGAASDEEEGDGHGEGDAGDDGDDTAATASDASPADDGDDGATRAMAIGGLALGAVGVAVGGAALAKARRG